MTSQDDNVTIIKRNTADSALRAQIDQAIKTLNNELSPAHREMRGTGPRPLDLYAYDPAGQLVGGLVAETYWGWLEVLDLWLREEYRHKGLGTTLLETAEKEARLRGCNRVFLRTFSFQAREFYEKNGYIIVGALDDYPPGESFYWLRKEL
jgi:GNAT superfamily N-acetyltransferase